MTLPACQAHDQVCWQWNQDQTDTEKEVVEQASSTILSECPKFRILIIGGTGVGKSTICKEVFGIDELRAGISHGTRGTHDINKGVTYPGQNERIVIHDSRGFEGGESESFDEVKKFIKSKRRSTTIAGQLHCIWYCISCENENRPIQACEEAFFGDLPKLVGKIPVIVVFTKYDELVKKTYAEWIANNLNRVVTGQVNETERVQTIRELSSERFEKTWNKQYSATINDIHVPSVQVALPPPDQGDDLKKIIRRTGVQKLVDMTVRNLQNHDLKTLWVSAQNHWAGLKCHQSVEIAMECFPSSMGWESVPLILGLSGVAFWRNFTLLFRRISPLWNIIDKSSLLWEGKVQREAIKAIFDVNAWGMIAVKAIDIFGFVDAPITASILAKAVAGVTLIHEDLFFLQKAQFANNQMVHSLTRQELTTVLTNFRRGTLNKVMSSHIDGSGFIFKSYSRQKVLEVISEAIRVARAQNQREFS